MTGFQPSLVRRLVLAFTLGPVVAFALLLLAIRPSVAHLAETNTGPDVAIVLIAAELERRPDGSLTVASSSPVHRIAARSDRFWYVVGDGRSSWSFGSVPEEMRRFRRQLSGTIKEAQFGDPEGSNRAADWSVMQTDTPVGPMTIYAGGVNPDAIGNMEWLLFAHHDQEIYIGLILLALVYAAGWPLAVPIVLAALRPTARAASHLDPSRPDERLPEARVVKELRPIVQSFNAALDRLAAAYERRRRFIADIAHELRTPLAVLTMHVEETPESGNKSDLQRTVYRLHQMVGQMLDAERLAMTNRAHDLIDLVDLARSTVAEIAPLAIANGYEMSLKAARERVTVRGDPHAIARALSNLLGNAVAHGGGSGLIEVRVSESGWIDVADQGPGIAPGAAERIFEPFHRERWDKDGCGLGLHLVSEVMRAHGGHARVIGSGPGATLRLEFAGVS